MANNRLYIVAPDGERFCLAKSFGHGWKLCPHAEGRLDPPELVEALAYSRALLEFFEEHDIGEDPAAWDIGSDPTTFRLVDENHEE